MYLKEDEDITKPQKQQNLVVEHKHLNPVLR